MAKLTKLFYVMFYFVFLFLVAINGDLLCENDSDCKTKIVCTLRRVPVCKFEICKCKFPSGRGFLSKVENHSYAPSHKKELRTILCKGRFARVRLSSRSNHLTLF
ncbi:unnamed protein product [Trifolium pratense]|uniref:Uncharacterized protein n=1 Tax=Trifolium pratense TaxID=57577 RepID=A0ACB0JWQ5_TRIPR|nr:unnamed protein product [Trifolium pratense]